MRIKVKMQKTEMSIKQKKVRKKKKKKEMSEMNEEFGGKGKTNKREENGLR